ncbi:MAG: transcription antitermination protein NusB [Muribaculaceae bacterium]|nr:transcription antitermination protein NusB [Muribaculaceae bacterium]
MINRVLIRIKVVQLLYSFLLTDNRFMLESQPLAPTKEKRFAYNLYLDMLILMIRISQRIEKRGGYLPLHDTRFIKKILADEKIKSLQMRFRQDQFPFERLVDSLAEEVKESGIYKNFQKNTSEAEDDQVWERIFNLIIYVNPALNAAISKRENFTIRGVERMKEMMSDTFKNFYASRDNISDAVNTLSVSMGKARELYFRLLLLPVELVNLRRDQLEENRNKYVPTDEDLNPNMRFVENQLVAAISEDPDMIEYVEENRLSWMAEDRQLLESILSTVMDSEVYRDYMRFPATDFQTDCDFWRDIFKYVILNDENFLEALETKSVFWNDDLDIISTFVLKTIRRFEEGCPGNRPVLPMYKDEEDAQFGVKLFSDVVKNKDVYRRYIDDSVVSEKWDSERLAFMDVVITMTALSEIVNFPKIPLVVSINEYIEIAKSYSTSKSGAFVNGLLYSISNKLREENKIRK